MALALLVLNMSLYQLIEGTFALFVYGEEYAVSNYSKTKEVSKDDEQLGIDNVEISRLYSPKEIFSLIFSIEVALLIALWKFVIGFVNRIYSPAAGADINALCVGIGGIGKTTLIRKFYGKSTGEIQVTRKFQHVRLLQPIDNQTRSVSLFDFVGQDVPNLIEEVIKLKSQEVRINMVIFILGLFEVESSKRSGQYCVASPACQSDQDKMFTRMVKEQKKQIFNSSTLSMIVDNLPGLERIVIMFNQADLLTNNQAGKLVCDYNHLHETYLKQFEQIIREIEDSAERYREKYNHKPLKIEYRFASILNGIEFVKSEEGSCRIKQLSVIEDAIAKR